MKVLNNDLLLNKMKTQKDIKVKRTIEVLSCVVQYYENKMKKQLLFRLESVLSDVELVRMFSIFSRDFTV